MKIQDIQIEIAAVRALLDDLYTNFDTYDLHDVMAGIDACSTMLLDLEGELDHAEGC